MNIWAGYTVNVDSNSGTTATDGPYGSGHGKLTNSAKLGYPCAADTYYPTGQGGNGGNHQLAGFSILYFDGSVRWKSNTSNYLTKNCGVNGNILSNNTTGVVPAEDNNFWQVVKY